MTLSIYSERKFYAIFRYWDVADDYADPMFNYLVYGFSPGSFFTHVLCNDWIGAILSSHPANQIVPLKSLTRWMVNCMPREAFGDAGRVQKWLEMSGEERRRILEECDLILTPEQETWTALNDH